MTSTAAKMIQPGLKLASAQSASASRAVDIWLWSVAAIVFAMIVVGGATRLTGSGLSITEWKPILGAIPPLNDADWLAAFEKYKQIPQYALVNAGMSLADFKFIYAWEWSHRLLGRLIGVAFALPFLYFWVTGKLRAGQPVKLLSVLALGGLQGAIGWYMVSSGLADRVDVSQYRLALHLSVAFTLLGVLIWFALDERRDHIVSRGVAVPFNIRWLALALVGLVFVQVVLGGFVAGLKAGLVYNTWPDMNGMFWPSDYWLPGRGALSIFESHAAVQFNHRLSAYLLGAAALLQIWQVTRSGVSRLVRCSVFVLGAAIFAQMTLGIATLLAHVPLPLGLMHQGGGAIVLMVAVWHAYVSQDRSA